MNPKDYKVYKIIEAAMEVHRNLYADVRVDE